MKILPALLLATAACYVSASAAENKATFVILPDTQTYFEQCPEVLESQIDWIVENHNDIDAVLQVGDLTQENYPAEWFLARKMMARIDSVGLPLSLNLGNHDIGSRPFQYSDTYKTDVANHYFPLSERAEKPYWGGNLHEGRIDAHYINVNAGGANWKIISLPFGPTDKELEWAGQIADKYPDSYIVLNTHAYLYCDSTLIDGKDSWKPTNYGYANDSLRGRPNDGDGIWEKFVSRHKNVIAVFCGHILKTGVGTRVGKGVNGNAVYEMLANFQRGVTGSKMGGEGYLRIATFHFDTKELEVKTYSPWLKRYHESPTHNFIFKNVAYPQYITHE